MGRRFGRAIEAGGRTFVPVAESIRARSPRGAAGLVWNRPVGIRIEEAGASRYVAIQDRTREIQWMLLGVGLVAALCIRKEGRRGRRRDRREPKRFFRR